LTRYRDGGDYVGENAVGVEAFELGFGFEHDAVTQDGLDGALDVVGNEVVAAIEGGGGLGYTHEADGGAGACA